MCKKQGRNELFSAPQGMNKREVGDYFTLAPSCHFLGVSSIAFGI